MNYLLRNKYGIGVEVKHSEIVSFERYGNGTVLVLNKNGSLSRQSIEMSLDGFLKIYKS